MMPNPPTWIRPRITTSPNADQYEPVSTVTSAGHAHRAGGGEQRGDEVGAALAGAGDREQEQRGPDQDRTGEAGDDQLRGRAQAEGAQAPPGGGAWHEPTLGPAGAPAVGRAPQTNALSPVIARPTMRVLISRVPS